MSFIITLRKVEKEVEAEEEEADNTNTNNNFYTHTTYNDNNVMMLNVLSCLANVVIFIGLSSQINFIVDRFSYYIVLFVVCHLVFFR